MMSRCLSPKHCTLRCSKKEAGQQKGAQDSLYPFLRSQSDPVSKTPGLQKPGIRTRTTCGQLNLNDLAAHLLDALLLTKPVFVGNQLGEIGIL